MVTARELIVEAERRGARFEVIGDRLRAMPKDAIDAELYRAIGTRKAEVVDELRRREQSTINPARRAIPRPESPALSGHGVMCAVCRRLAQCYQDAAGLNVCPGCAEWWIAGCARFTVLDAAHEASQVRGACLACGASWELHGQPDSEQWRRARDLDDVELLSVRFVVAAATAIARGA